MSPNCAAILTLRLSLFSQFAGRFSCYQKTGLLAEFEERLRKLLLEWESRYAFRDPIDMGPISYLVRKQNEMQNLWWIAKGIQLGFDSVDIIEHLEILQ